MLKKRIIACLDVANGRVVKGVRFRDHEDVGDILELAEAYSAQGIDELVFYDILASTAQRGVAPDWVAQVAGRIDIPFCVAGGIRSLAQAEQVLAAGADKISINTPALEDPQLITTLAERFGSQCVVVGIDSLQDADGQWRVRSHTGNPDTMRERGLKTLDWLDQVQQRGAGCAQHFIDVFQYCDVDGALAAGIFHRKLVSIPALKQELAQQGIAIRL